MNARANPAALARPVLHLGAEASAVHASAYVPACAAPRQAQIPAHDARALTGPGGQAQIVLDGQVYALRITRAGKLILTK